MTLTNSMKNMVYQMLQRDWLGIHTQQAYGISLGICCISNMLKTLDHGLKFVEHS